MKKCIVVLGMHRSGTSVLSGLISLLGCEIGKTDTMPKRKDNPKGFYENYRIYQFNQKLLEDCQVSWDEYAFTTKDLSEKSFRKYVDQVKEIIIQEFESVDLGFIKDPRMCLLYPIWETALKELNVEIKCIFVNRSALEVALSLKDRNQFNTEKSLMIWSHYFFQAELLSRKSNRIFIQYDQDFSNINQLMVNISDFIGVECTGETLKQANDFYSPKLKNQNLALENISKEVPDYLRAMVELIIKCDLENFELIDQIRLEFNRSIKFYMHNEKFLESRLNDLETEQSTLSKELERNKSHNQILLNNKKVLEQLVKKLNNSLNDRKKKIELLLTLRKQELSKNKKLSNINSALKSDAANLKHLNNQYKENSINNINFLNELKNRLLVSDSVVEKLLNNKVFYKQILNTLKPASRFNLFINRLMANNQRKKAINDRQVIIRSGYFSALYYLTKNKDVFESGADPLDHFCQHGWKELRDPSPTFSIKGYFNNNPDVKESGNNPLLHFILFGEKENRKTGYEFPLGEYDDKNIYCVGGDQNVQITTKNTELTLDDSPINTTIDINSGSMHINEDNILSFDSLKDYYNNLNSINPLEHEPKVSIIVLNRNGLEHLQRLFDSIKQNTLYKNYEIIVVENASDDGSVDFLEKNQFKLPLRVLRNAKNVTFSAGNNQAAAVAQGEYLLLLNNDVEPMKGWLTHLVSSITQKSQDKIGSVSAKLIYPYKENFENSCQVQHAGIAFNDEVGLYRPYNIGTGKQPKDNYLTDCNHAALTGACILIHKDTYNEVQGLDESYNYGYEDVDLGLKLVKAGYSNLLSTKAILFHYEFGTQDVDSNAIKRERRLNNIEVFNKKWNHFLKKNYWAEKINGQSSVFVENPLTVAFAVTDAGENIPEGDYFTASELAQEFQQLGYDIVYLRRKHDEWYKIPDQVDVLITLLDAYDLSLLPQRNKRLTTIAWARNWFDRWSNNPSINQFDYVFASSQIACQYMDDHTLQKSLLMPIATNPKKFNMNKRIANQDFVCDYCFTGSYWNDDREIVQFLDPKLFPDFKFNIYGKNWDKIEKFKAYDQGFLPYGDIPLVYSNSRIVIDDANRVTKPYGSVNSRVFDALSAGTLVITNGVLGSELTFNGELPSFSNQQELNELLNLYLNNEEARLEKVNQLREMVLQSHTYKHRANTVKELLINRFNSPSIAIKIPAPKWESVHEWGDYHFAVALKKELNALGYYVIIQTLYEWDNDIGNECDSVIVLRGLNRYTVKEHQTNIMWNISHPDKVSIDEYNDYDQVFIASKTWADKIAKEANVPVCCMLQCTDAEVFKFNQEKSKEHSNQILFVGNSRKIHRKIIKDILPSEFDVSIYGSLWQGLVHDKYIKGDHIPNHQLHKYYRSADILLNDHWDDMREKGFISNRLFDALAAGAFVISDEIEGLNELFDNSIVTYSNKEELKDKVKSFLNNPEKRESMSQRGKDIVRKHHTFKARALQIHNILLEKH